MHVMKTKTILLALLIAFVLLLWSTSGDSQQAASQITIDVPVEDDQYLAGRSIQVLDRIDGDLVAAARRVSVEQSVTEDIIIAAERVVVRGSIGDDARVAGRIVTISGAVGDDLAAAGETVSLTSGSTVGGRMWAAGRLVEVDGNVDEGLYAAGQSVVIGGDVRGHVSVIAETLELLPSARIDGNLTYRSNNKATIANGAVVSGSVEQLDLGDLDEPKPALFPILAGSLISALFCMGILYWLFPGLLREASSDMYSSPLKYLGLGLVAFLGIPLTGLFLIVTVLGAPLGLALLLCYPVAMLLAWAIGIYFVSNLLLKKVTGDRNAGVGRRLLGFLLAIVAVFVCLFLPFVGPLLVLFLILTSLGALAQRVTRLRSLR